MVCRRIALGSLLIVLSALVFVSSCTNPECANGGDGCPCTTPYDCELPNGCYSVYCDGTCHVQANEAGVRCWIFPCPHPDYCYGVCTAEPQCVECLEDAHCGAGHACEVGNVCSRCDDGVKNGDETGVDCGGSCPLCPGTCNVDMDCPDGYCWEGSCVSCHDGIKNGDETGVDCSRGVLGHCLFCLGEGCGTVINNCASKHCEDSVCCPGPCPLCYECEYGTGKCKPMSGGKTDETTGPEPIETCVGDYICDGAGKCGLDWGKPCTQSSECAFSSCTNGKCTP